MLYGVDFHFDQGNYGVLEMLGRVGIPNVFFNFEMRRLKGSRDVPGRYRVLQTTAMRALASESSEDCRTSESLR